MLQLLSRLDIDVRFPEIQIASKPPILHLQRKDPQVQIDIDLPRVHIDQQAAREELGNKGLYSFGQQRRDAVRAQVLSTIGAVAREGDRLRDIHLGVTMAQVVAERTTPPIPEVTVVALPATRPKVEATGDLKIRLAAGSVIARSELGKVTVGVKRGEVKVTLDHAHLGQRIDRIV